MPLLPLIPYAPVPPLRNGMDGTEWNKDFDSYALAFEAAVRVKERAATESKAHYTVSDYYRRAGDMIQYARKDRDAEMLLAYHDWIFKINDMAAVRSTVQVLRKHHEGPVRHLVTEQRIKSCLSVCEAIMNRGGYDWDENLECAYLTFYDPEMLEKVLLVAREGIRGRANILQRLEIVEGIEPALMDGAL